MNIIIDCGACKGKAKEGLKETYKGFEYIAFEPNPKLYDYLDKNNFDYRKEAVWIKNDTIDFYPAENIESSTLYKNKTTGKVSSTPVKVQAIDFSEFLRQFSTDDYIVVKMDIEGAEYDVLEHLIKTRTIKYINELLCEFHHHKIPTISRKRHRNLLSKLRKKTDVYIQNDKTFIGKTIYYTAIFGWYDNLKDPKEVDKSGKYVCICDKYTYNNLKDKCKVWEFKVVEPKFKSLRRENRFWKINSHIALKDYYYRYSVYIDGRFQFYKNFGHRIEHWLGSNNFALETHPDLSCAYKMATYYKRFKIDKPQIIEKQIKKYKKEHFPKNLGLAGNYFIIRRHNRAIEKVNKIWWEQIKNFSVRDQNSFTYAMWKANQEWSKLPIENQFKNDLKKENMIVKKGEHRIDYEEGKIIKDLIVIGCGLPKTGTKTLVKALKILGFKSIHYLYSPDLSYKRSVYHMIDKCNVRGTAENAGIICYKDLYFRYPNSKFILTKRDLKSWLASCKHQLNVKHPIGSKIVKEKNIEVRKRTFGWFEFDKKKLATQYKTHHKEVRNFFKDKQNRFMEMNIIKGDGWEKLCSFLNKPIPNKPFPHKNKSRRK